jgi:hypothetical protein
MEEVTATDPVPVMMIYARWKRKVAENTQNKKKHLGMRQRRLCDGWLWKLVAGDGGTRSHARI